MRGVFSKCFLGAVKCDVRAVSNHADMTHVPMTTFFGNDSGDRSFDVVAMGGRAGSRSPILDVNAGTGKVVFWNSPCWLLACSYEDERMAAKGVKKKSVLTKDKTADETGPGPKEPNAESLEALAELESGELTRYSDTADMFKKLGIKVGKA
jgi:hypothetical protein